MFSRALRKRREMMTNLHRSITQRVDLKTTTLDLRNNVRLSSQSANNFDALVRNHKRHQFVVDRRVLNQRAHAAKCFLQLVYREQVVSCMISGRASMLKLARDVEQLAFAFEQLAF